MPIDLTKPILWKDKNPLQEAMLRNLQGNILKGHGRNYVTILFIQFDSEKSADAREFISVAAANHMHDALTHLSEAEIFKSTGKSGKVFVGAFLTALGYQYLEIDDSKWPDDPAFRNGMKSRGQELKDPNPDSWEEGYEDTIHMAILVADDLKARVDAVRNELVINLNGIGRVVVREDGRGLRNGSGNGIEHFGYVDGRSQPLMLLEDIRGEENSGGIDHWDPTVGLEAALVPDPGDPAEANFGSYLVFRKLEQNVREFKAREKTLATDLELENPELAGALVVGRFEDGTPVTLQNVDGLHSPVPNNFSFDHDTEGGKCPFHAHIRKTNPRGDSVREFGVPLEEERAHLMPRRGIPYGERATHPNDEAQEGDPSLYPTGGVGLLFMAYNSDIAEQFEFTQISWANNPGFVKGTGIDPVIGQGGNPSGLQSWPARWDATNSPSDQLVSDFSGFVTMKGGEYFFAPCLSFLRGL